MLADYTIFKAFTQTSGYTFLYLINWKISCRHISFRRPFSLYLLQHNPSALDKPNLRSESARYCPNFLQLTKPERLF